MHNRPENLSDQDMSGETSAEALAAAPTQAAMRTALYDFHVRHGAKMVEFAGYDMPVQYPLGVMGEHLHCREKAGLFDVSHMGQAWLRAVDKSKSGDDLATLIETLVPGGIATLGPGRIRYTLLMNESGGIQDDLMVTRRGEDLWLVVNAGCKQNDFAYISEKLAGHAALDIYDEALLALQGPEAVHVLTDILGSSAIAELAFMEACEAKWNDVSLYVSRCGYTGEDGFEISLAADKADAFAEALLGDIRVALCGLGARDSLRLEAGLCLYGHDIDPGTSPAEADLLWSIPKRRREAADFPGAERLLRELETGIERLRVGILPEGRAPAREGTEICDTKTGDIIGHVTSGGFAPSLKAPIAMGYINAPHHQLGNSIHLLIRGKAMPATIVDMPFVPQNYVSSKKA